MSLDPRIIKQMLQLNMTPTFDIVSGNSNTNGSDIDFATLLTALLGQTADQGNRTSGASTSPQTVRPLSVAFTPAPVSLSGQIHFNSYISEASARFGIDAGLVKAVIHSESSFDPNAVSSSGAKGLMQLMDGTAQALGVTDPFDPEQNIEGGTNYLAALINKYDGSKAAALAAYNAGPGRVDRLGITGEQTLWQKMDELPAETQRYVHKVLDKWRSYSVNTL